MTRPVPTTPPSSLELDDDDRPIGRILSRREVLALIGASGTAASSPPARLAEGRRLRLREPLPARA